MELAEHAIRTTMEDVCTLLSNSGLTHSYWAEAAAYSVTTHNLIPSCRHPGKIPLESFTGKSQDVSHLRVFGAKCWAKIPTVHGVQVPRGSKLDSRGVECRLLGYAGGIGNYKVQNTESRHVFMSEIIFEEGQPHCTSPNVGENLPPRSYQHAMTTDPDCRMVTMQVKMVTLMAKDTWDLVKPLTGANIMDLMWIYNIKWNGKGNRTKDKARLIGKGYIQQLSIDYNETWAGVTRLESVILTAAIAAKRDLKLWHIDVVGAYLNSLTKEDVYMKQPEGFTQPGFKIYICKLVFGSPVSGLEKDRNWTGLGPIELQIPRTAKDCNCSPVCGPSPLRKFQD
jgi:hypothetical protein